MMEISGVDSDRYSILNWGDFAMKSCHWASAILMVFSLVSPVGAAHRYPQHYGYQNRYSSSPVHTAYGIYPYSYSNPAFRMGSGTVAGTNAVMMQAMSSNQLRSAMVQQQSIHRMRAAIDHQQSINSMKMSAAEAQHQSAIKSRSHKSMADQDDAGRLAK